MNHQTTLNKATLNKAVRHPELYGSSKQEAELPFEFKRKDSWPLLGILIQ